MMEEVEQLRQTLAQKEQQLQQAALYGQQLYTQLLESKERVESRDTELAQAHDRISELEAEAAQQKSKARDGAGSMGSVAVVDEMDDSRSKEDVMEAQLRDSTKANRDLLATLQEKERELARLVATERELAELKKSANAELERMDELAVEAEAERKAKEEAQHRILQLETELKGEKERGVDLQQKLDDAQREYRDRSAAQKQPIAKMKRDLDEAHTKLQEQEEALEQMRLTKRKLEEAVTHMAKEQQQLYKERDEYLQFLEEARSTVATLREHRDEQTLDVGLGLIDEIGSDNTFLDDLGKEVESRIAHSSKGEEEAAGPSLSADGSMAAPASAKSTAEYFYLAATAVKIGLAIRNPRTSDGVFRLNLKALYDQAVANDVPFHEWYKWLEVQLSRKMEALNASVTSDEEDPVNFVDSEFSSADFDRPLADERAGTSAHPPASSNKRCAPS
eukprot:TRINITY_DN174_c0_g1_i1.p1 TRINITY_DN174_c0_g1~~TRINITY_DN174_c0_g1_i1.p1  ORF type:complete len:450 (-),score=191.21 TRINITY_DN174_c0_g1_i1:125-1474(-)